MTQEELNAALAASPSPDRVTPEYLKSRIVQTTFERLAEGTMTLCVIRLDNGFQVIGESACADPANYNREIGEKVAYDVAERKIWPLLGFALKEAMAARDARPVAASWQDRVRLEHDELYARMKKLGVFLNTPDFDALVLEGQELLHQQYEAMDNYRRVLAARISGF